MKRYLGMTVSDVHIKYEKDSTNKVSGVSITFDGGDIFKFSSLDDTGNVVSADTFEIDNEFCGNKIEYMAVSIGNSGEFCYEPFDCEFEIRVEGDSWLRFKASVDVEYKKRPRGFLIEHFQQEIVEEFEVECNN